MWPRTLIETGVVDQFEWSPILVNRVKCMLDNTEQPVYHWTCLSYQLAPLKRTDRLPERTDYNHASPMWTSSEGYLTYANNHAIPLHGICYA